MYFYFQTEFKAAVKINGELCGTSDCRNKIRREFADAPLVEICPLGGNALYSAFYPDAEFLSAPPDFSAALGGSTPMQSQISAQSAASEILLKSIAFTSQKPTFSSNSI